MSSTDTTKAAEPLTLYDAVRHLNPCAAAAEWLRQFDLEEAGACWEETDCGEWLWWLVSRTVKDDRVLRRLLVRFAEEVAYLHEEPDCLAAVELALAYADGDIGADEFRAAESAAWSAARSAARNAAESAARSAAESAARNAAESAARSAAESAARNAAESAAWNAAESAAWNAAESAARSAARNAAESAAWSAAESAAESAAWSAAWRAARSAAWGAAWSAARNAAESAAWSAARSAAESAAWSAEDTMDRRQADIVREVVPLSLVLDGLGVRHA